MVPTSDGFRLDISEPLDSLYPPRFYFQKNITASKGNVK